MTSESPPNTPSGPDAFGALINATCELVGVAPAHAWLDANVANHRFAAFHIDGVECILSHRSADPDSLFIHCVYGHVPQARSVDALLTLLQLNATMLGRHSPVFGADTQGRLMLCLERGLEGLHAAALAQHLEDLATQAISWRKAWATP